MAHDGRQRIVILGAGFAGLGLARELERLGAEGAGLDVTLVGREAACLLTPWLFEVVSGRLAPRHVTNQVEATLERTRFVPGEVTAIDVERRVILVAPSGAGDALTLPYDALVLALGGVARAAGVPGAGHAHAFKTLADAIALHDHLRACAQAAAACPVGPGRDAAAGVVIVGAGLVGVELAGEIAGCLPRFLREAGCQRPAGGHVTLIEAGARVLGELDPALGAQAVRLLAKRGVAVATGLPVLAIEPGGVVLPDHGFLPASTVILATGVAPHPLIATLPLARGAGGRLAVDATMRSRERPEIWALGDCAAVPEATGGVCSPLAQHAVRQAERLAANLLAAARGDRLWPYAHVAHGAMAALGPGQAAGQLFGWRAWGSWVSWLREAYYMWDLPAPETRRGILRDRLGEVFRGGLQAMRFEPGGWLPPAPPPAMRVTFGPLAPEAPDASGAVDAPREESH